MIAKGVFRGTNKALRSKDITSYETLVAQLRKVFPAIPERFEIAYEDEDRDILHIEGQEDYETLVEQTPPERKVKVWVKVDGEDLNQSVYSQSTENSELSKAIAEAQAAAKAESKRTVKREEVPVVEAKEVKKEEVKEVKKEEVKKVGEGSVKEEKVKKEKPKEPRETKENGRGLGKSRAEEAKPKPEDPPAKTKQPEIKSPAPAPAPPSPSPPPSAKQSKAKPADPPKVEQAAKKKEEPKKTQPKKVEQPKKQQSKKSEPNKQQPKSQTAKSATKTESKQQQKKEEQKQQEDEQEKEEVPKQKPKKQKPPKPKNTFKHTGISCYQCKAKDIVGDRWKSLTRLDSDLCETCYGLQPRKEGDFVLIEDENFWNSINYSYSIRRLFDPDYHVHHGNSHSIEEWIREGDVASNTHAFVNEVWRASEKMVSDIAAEFTQWEEEYRRKSVK